MPQLKDGKTEYMDLFHRMTYKTNKTIDRTHTTSDEVRQKLAKNRAWLVCASGNDLENKRFWYKCLVNSDETAMKTISFEEACEDFHWKSFKFSNNEQTINFIDDPEWKEEIVKIEQRIKKQQKKEAATMQKK